jgi:phage terminase small subunit
MTSKHLAHLEPDEALGPAMQALNERQRRFVTALFEVPSGYGQLAAAAREAGYGAESTPAVVAQIAQNLATNDKVIAAINEVAKKTVRGKLIPAAVAAMSEIVNDITHKDRARMALSVLERVDPVETKHSVEVTHRTLSPLEQDLKVLEGMRTIGASREHMRDFFGDGLERLEAMLDASKPKPPVEAIEGTFTEIDDLGDVL